MFFQCIKGDRDADATEHLSYAAGWGILAHGPWWIWDYLRKCEYQWWGKVYRWREGMITIVSYHKMTIQSYTPSLHTINMTSFHGLLAKNIEGINTQSSGVVCFEADDREPTQCIQWLLNFLFSEEHGERGCKLKCFLQHQFGSVFGFIFNLGWRMVET